MKAKTYRVLFSLLIFGLIGSLTPVFGQSNRDTRTLFGHNVDGLKPVKLIFASYGRANSVMNAGDQLFAKLVENESQGKIQIDMHLNASLYKMTDIPKVLARGTIDIGAINKGFLMTREPGYGPWVVAYQWKSAEHMFSATSSSEWAEMEEQLSKKKWRIKPICQVPSGQWDYWSSTPIKTMKDFRGKRVWSYGQLSNAYIRSWGGTPVIKSVSEMYMAYRKGDLHAISFSPNGYGEAKFYEGGKYRIGVPPIPPRAMANHYQYLYMNRKSWDKLPDAYKKIFLDAGDLMTWFMIWETYAVTSVWDYRLVAEKGVTDLGMVTKTPAEYQKVADAAIAAGKKFVFSRGVTQQQWDNAQVILAKYGKDEYTSQFSWWYKLAEVEAGRRLEIMKKAAAAGKSDAAFKQIHVNRILEKSYAEQKAYMESIPRLARDWDMKLRMK